MVALRRAGLVLAAATAAAPVFAQRELSGAAEIRQSLGRLRNTASALMIGAHPDDENTAVLAWLARGRKARAGYLSLTRGEGGQNLIGPEQGDLLGVIRTQELLSARRIDGAEQYFTRAIDFGFSKTAEETLEKWGHDRILSDVVWNIRRFRPDVIILRFSGTPRDGHGHHQASAMLGKEAFAAAADPSRFPEQLKWVQPWQARRILWNAFSFNREQEREAEKLAGRIGIDAGQFDPVLGHSYGEIAGMSRSQHRSQGMGSPERRGSQENFFVTVGGDPARTDMFEGVDTTWRRVTGGAKIGEILERAESAFDADHPEKAIPALLEARALIAAARDPIAIRKLADIDEAVALCAGMWLDASASDWSAAPGGSVNVTATAIRRGGESVTWTGLKLEGIPGAPAVADPMPLAGNQPATRSLTVNIPASQPYSQPYWLVKPKSGETYTVDNQELIGLAEGAPALSARFRLSIAGQPIELERPVRRRYVDRVLGELTRPFEVVPAVAIRMPEAALVLPSGAPRAVEVSVRANVKDGAKGVLRLKAPHGWTIEPNDLPFSMAGADEQATLAFRLTPPSGETRTELRATAEIGGGAVASGMTIIDYPHIPVLALFPPAAVPLVRTEARSLARRVGYVMGAGDEVPGALKQLGCEVALLSSDDLARADFSGFDAIVTGVRAYNVRPDLRANQQRLLDYVKNGGTMVVQYNVLEGGFGGGDPTILSRIGPYPIRIGRDRVTVEDAPVRFPNPNAPILLQPNKIDAKDFEGWIQERGLYFAAGWAPEYAPVFETHDPGEKPLEGATLFTRYGKGAYIFTAFSWFRELPAGVPGAYRIFANFISAGKIP